MSVWDRKGELNAGRCWIRHFTLQCYLSLNHWLGVGGADLPQQPELIVKTYTKAGT